MPSRPTRPSVRAALPTIALTGVVLPVLLAAAPASASVAGSAPPRNGASVRAYARPPAAAAPARGDLATGVTGSWAPTAGEVYDVPASGVFTLDGHGWGHGHGMSQYGAQGGGSHGVSAATMLAGYYPGTTPVAYANSPVRVQLRGDDGVDTVVRAQPGMVATDLATGYGIGLPDGPSRWRAVVVGGREQLQQDSGSGWTAYPLGGATTVGGPVAFSASQPVVVAFPDGSARAYRGTVEAVQTGATRLATVDVVAMEDYLRGVVPRESPSSWSPAALQVQAVAARTYAAQQRFAAGAGSAWDICDTTACQVYGGAAYYPPGGGGVSLEAASSDAAVAATAGEVLTYGGRPAFTQFSASDGGWTVDGGLPYLSAHADPWDGMVPNSLHAWTATLPASSLEAAYPAVGHLLRLVVASRDGNGDWGGRVGSVVLQGVAADGTPTSVTTSGTAIYGMHAWPGWSSGLKSSWWHVRDAPAVAFSSRPQGVDPSRPLAVSVARNARVAVTLRFLNTGLRAWPLSGAVRLGTSGPRDRVSASAGPGWLSPTRPQALTSVEGVPGATSVAPGQVGVVSFWVYGSALAPGTTTETFEPAWDGVHWLDGGAVTLAVTRTNDGVPAFSALSVGPVPTVSVPRFSRVPVTLRFRNAGTWAWPVAGLARLATSGPRGRVSSSRGPGWLAPTRPQAFAVVEGVPDARVVLPGQVADVSFWVYGNGLPAGTTTESFEPVWDGVHWLDGALTTVSETRT